jgi:hypothetical protein
MSFREILITETIAEWPEGHNRNRLKRGDEIVWLRAKEQIVDPRDLRHFMLCGVEANRFSCTYNVGYESVIYLLSRLRNPSHPFPALPTGELICGWIGEAATMLAIGDHEIEIRVFSDKPSEQERADWWEHIIRWIDDRLEEL